MDSALHTEVKPQLKSTKPAAAEFNSANPDDHLIGENTQPVKSPSIGNAPQRAWIIVDENWW
jgi:hypothetical protein